MRIILAIALFAAAAFAAPVDDDLDLPVACEDVLAAQVCTKLREIADKIGVNVGKIEDVIKAAIANGQQRAEEIYNKVVEFLKKEAESKTCEDLLSSKTCDRLKKLAKVFSIAVEKVDDFVRRAVIDGATKIREIYQRVVQYLRGLLKEKRSLAITVTDHDLELFDEIEMEDEDEFEKRNIIFDIIRKKIEFFVKVFGGVVLPNLENVINHLMTERRAEIESLIGKGPFAVAGFAWDLYMKLKGMGGNPPPPPGF